MKGNKGGKPCAGRGNEIESRDLILLKRSISEFRQPNTDRTGRAEYWQKRSYIDIQRGLLKFQLSINMAIYKNKLHKGREKIT